MSDDKSKVTDKASEIAKNIWLAGVGAYGKAVDEAQTNLKKAAPTPPKLFRDLVKAGSALEEEATGARDAALSSVEERISQVRENFHMQRLARTEDLEGLHSKVDKLTRKVDALTKLIKEQQVTAKVPAKKKPAAKKKAAARQAPRKKAAAKSGTKSVKKKV
ncbi:MAG: phasin family protein [Halioglobus sp.]